MKITNIDTLIEEFRNGRNVWSRTVIELAVREIERLRKENHKLKVRLEASENDLVLIEVNEMLKKTQARVQELEHYKRLNEEWVHEKVEGLTTLEEIEKMAELAEKLSRKYAKEWIHCGWCKEKFETREEVKEHLLICKSNPLNEYIQRYEKLIVNLFSFLERDRLVRAHAKEMSEFIQEYRNIKARKNENKRDP